jgi:hypothetical protein
MVTVPLTQGQYDALVSFIFNEGTGRLQPSTLLKDLNAENYAAVPAQLMVWVMGGRVKLPGWCRSAHLGQVLIEWPFGMMRDDTRRVDSISTNKKRPREMIPVAFILNQILIVPNCSQSTERVHPKSLKIWWAVRDSIPSHHACKAGGLTN